MRFLKKNNLYYLIVFALFTSTGYLKEPISPHLFISEQNTNLFYAFNNNHISLYEISKTQTYNKVWEYHFLNNKSSELSSIMHQDITGNGKKELILILYAFGEQAEIYIFSTDKSMPVGKPDIYAFPSLKTGTKPTNAAMVNWDGDKDYEILVSLSSPERKIIIFDYNIDTLLPIDEIGESFLGSTYGLIDLHVTDINADKEEDIIIYNNNQQPSRHIIYSNETEENKDLSKFQNVQKIIPLLKTQTLQDIGLSSKGKLLNLSTGKTIVSTEDIVDIISSSSKHLVVLTKNQLIQYETPNIVQSNSISTTISTNEMFCISNQNSSAVLCSHTKEPIIFLYQFVSPLQEIKLQEENINSVIPELAVDETESTQDTIFVNVGDLITIDVAQEHPIKSIETVQKPSSIKLDAQKLQFNWSTLPADIGEHILEYDITYNMQTILQKTNKPGNQVAINSIETIKNQNIRHFLYVNDPPKIVIDNIQDTIKIPGTYQTNYNIEDRFYISKEALKATGPSTLLIDSQTIYWEPTKKDAGNNTFILSINDGLAQDTLRLDMFVDTTTTQIQHNQTELIATVNEEFIYQLQHRPGQKYTIINGPNNVWVSKKGKIHWIPIITQIENNLLEIEVSGNNMKEKHQLNIFVNAPPIISYRPDNQETILQNDSLLFQLQSFDMNTNPQLRWSLLETNIPNNIILSNTGKLSIYSDSLLDNYQYSLHLSDGMKEDIFLGQIYVNNPPLIISIPPNYLSLGDTLQYQIMTKDLNTEKPFNPTLSNELSYFLNDAPSNATFNQNTKEVFWIPQTKHIGSNTFAISVTDSMHTDTQNFSIFVNDTPSIISVDSLSIAVGDTLEHYFNAADLNTDTELVYCIKTTIDELFFSGKLGKLTWVPTLSDIGLHTLEISVSDGFSNGEDTQKLKIFVYSLPQMLNKPPEEAFVNLEYLYNPLAVDMFGNTVIQEDIMFDLENTDSLFTGSYDLINNSIYWVPTMAELGERQIRLVVSDKYNNTITTDYLINVLLSPCEPTDTLQQIPTIIRDTISIEKTDTVYIDKKPKSPTQNNLKWKPKGLGF